MATLITLSTTTSVIQQAITKLQKDYKGNEGWSTRDIINGYNLFENTVKAEIFIAFDG